MGLPSSYPQFPIRLGSFLVWVLKVLCGGYHIRIHYMRKLGHSHPLREAPHQTRSVLLRGELHFLLVLGLKK